MINPGEPYCKIYNNLLRMIQENLNTVLNQNELITYSFALVKLLKIKEDETVKFLLVKAIGKLTTFIEDKNKSDLSLDYLTKLLLEINTYIPSEELKGQIKVLSNSLISNEKLKYKAVGYYVKYIMEKNREYADSLLDLFLNAPNNEEKLRICTLLYLISEDEKFLKKFDEIAFSLGHTKEDAILKVWEESFYDPKTFPHENLEIIKGIFERHKTLETPKDFLIISAWLEGVIYWKKADLFFTYDQELNIPKMDIDLKPITDEFADSVIIGRSEGDHQKYNCNGLMYIGRVIERGEHFGKKVLLDAVDSHRIFICGRTGSGKSYTMGVIVEELNTSNLEVGIVIIDPTGLFYDIGKRPEMSEQKQLLEKWGLLPYAFTNVKVFVPLGIYDRLLPEFKKNSAPFAFRPSELTPDDWSNTFGIDPIKSTQSALLRTILELIKNGYQTIDGDYIEPKGENYSLDDMIFCLTHAEKIVGKSGLFRKDSIRALHYRLENAKRWGIFSNEGTPLTEISKANQISVIDLSFIQTDSVKALVTGLLARKLFDARYNIATSKKTGEITEKIPVTWLFVDEAHNFASSSKITPATEHLIKYAKEGRKYGCSLVLVTQQPSATHDAILSQMDIMITHSLSLKYDINAFKARSPSYIPNNVEIEDILATLPPGVAIVASQRQNRIFFCKIRPRITEHAGKTAKPPIRVALIGEEFQTIEEQAKPSITEPTEPVEKEVEQIEKPLESFKEIEPTELEVKSNEITEREEIASEEVEEEIEEEEEEDVISSIPPPLTINISADILAEYITRLIISKFRSYLLEMPYLQKFSFVSDEYFMPLLNNVKTVFEDLGFTLVEGYRLEDATIVEFSKDESAKVYVGIIASNDGKMAVGIVLMSSKKIIFPRDLQRQLSKGRRSK